MQMDIIKLAEIVGAVSLILSVIIGVYKLYDKLTDDVKTLTQRVAALESESRNIKKENTLVIYALRACPDGLHRQGCNGRVTEAIDMIDKHINKAAHDQD